VNATEICVHIYIFMLMCEWRYLVGMYMYTYTRACIHATNIYTSTHATYTGTKNKREDINVHIDVSFLYLCTHSYIYIYTHTHINTYIHIYMHAYLYIRTHRDREIKSDTSMISDRRSKSFGLCMCV
jgi:hypothetical protein